MASLTFRTKHGMIIELIDSETSLGSYLTIRATGPLAATEICLNREDVEELIDGLIEHLA